MSIHDITFFDIIGTVGANLIVFAYFKTRLGSWGSNDIKADLTNLLGAILLTISLLVNMNFGSLYIEIFWIGIALYGIYCRIRKPKPVTASAELS